MSFGVDIHSVQFKNLESVNIKQIQLLNIFNISW